MRVAWQAAFAQTSRSFGTVSFVIDVFVGLIANLPFAPLICWNAIGCSFFALLRTPVRPMRNGIIAATSSSSCIRLHSQSIENWMDEKDLSLLLCLTQCT